jgi:hypothetical protein
MYDIDLHSLLKADEGNGYVILAGDYRSIQTQFEQGDKLFVSLVGTGTTAAAPFFKASFKFYRWAGFTVSGGSHFERLAK